MLMQQLKALIWRNVLLKKRKRGELLQELLSPVLMIIILGLVKNVSNPELKPAIAYPVNTLDNFTPLTFATQIYATPKTAKVKQWMEDIVSQLEDFRKFDYELFNSADEAEKKYIKNSSLIFSGIIFNYKGKETSYALRFGHGKVPDTRRFKLNDTGSCRDNANGKSFCDANLYLHSGFARLQLAVENTLVLEFLGKNVSEVKNRHIKVQLMPKDEFQPDNAYIQSLSAIYFVMAFSHLMNYLSVNIVTEKSKKLKEGMLMMGLNSNALWFSWAIVYGLIVLIVAGLMATALSALEFFTKSNMFILYLVFFMYGISIISLAFLVSVFFKKEKTAGMFCSLGVPLISVLYLAVTLTREKGQYNSTIPFAVQLLMCFFSPISFATVIDQTIYLDFSRNGLGDTDSLEFGKFPIIIPILMLPIDTALYALLTLYFEAVLPGEYGARRHPLFFLNISNKSTVSRQPSNTQNALVADVEPVPDAIKNKVGIRISNLCKSFKTKKETIRAVNDFSLDIYQNQITCLLGHNSAGKTTIFNMLSGVIKPTSGTATIFSYKTTVSKDLWKIRQMSGICPQHNILYDNLSTREHLQLFARIKGVPVQEVEAAVKKSLEDVDLLNQADTFSCNLSGGQKRKLSVAMALIGKPKVIFLDEPTAGMDPVSRRHLWSLLKKNREGRVIVLTTHFMDEADILADRKAFVHQGKLRCCGSSLFLKSKFGIGYHLTMVVDDNCNHEKVTKELQKEIPTIELERHHGRELSYTVPMSELDKFPDLFNKIDYLKDSLRILSYGISMTTLEEVFLALENLEEVKEENIKQINSNINNNYKNSKTVLPDISTAEQAFVGTVRGRELAMQRLFALMKIRLINTVKSRMNVIFQFVMPVIFLALSLGIAKNVDVFDNNENPDPLSLEQNFYIKKSNSDLETPQLLVLDSIESSESKEIINKWKQSYFVESHSAGVTDLMEIRPHLVGIQMDNIVNSVLDSFVVIYNDTAIHSVPFVINLASNSILKSYKIKKKIEVITWPWPQTEFKNFFSPAAFQVPMILGISFLTIITGFSYDVSKDRETKLRNQLRVVGISFNMYWGSMYLFDLLIYCIPCVLMILLVLAMQIKGFSSGGAIFALLLLTMTNIPYNVLFGFICGFIFNNSEKTVTYLPPFIIYSAMIPYFIVSICDQTMPERDFPKILHYVLCFVDPCYMYMGGIYFVYKIFFVSSIMRTEVKFQDYFDPENHVIVAILAPLFHCVWTIYLLRMLDLSTTGSSFREHFFCLGVPHKSKANKHTENLSNEDDDVKQERETIQQIHRQHSLQFPAYTYELRKEFAKRTKDKKEVKVKVAVENLSIGIREGELLGLLGPNGAGKSTVMSIITAEATPTAGEVIINGENVRNNALSVLESFGFCPQYDPLWELVTLEDHIKCFAAIKGLSPEQNQNAVQYYIENLKLEAHRNKASKDLSGGTKRKLSYILSTLGCPKVVLMDEPSTGMDPQSKRFFWDSINASFSNTKRGAILTTHYMEEADALCSRVGIMINGQLK